MKISKLSANFSLETLKHKSGKVLISVVPPGVNRQEIYKKVIIEPIKKLENGQELGFIFATKKIMHLCGTLHCVIADDIGQRQAQVSSFWNIVVIFL